MHGIGEFRPRRRLPLDRQQATAGPDHEIHFLAASHSPVAELRALESRVAPGEQIVEHEVLEMGAARFRDCAKVQRDAGVASIQFRRLGEALRAVDGVGGQTHQQIRGLEEIQPTVDGGLRKSDIPAELGLVHELTEPQARRAHEAPVIGQAAHRRQVLQIALEIGADVAVEPDASISGIVERQCGRREAAAGR